MTRRHEKRRGDAHKGLSLIEVVVGLAIVGVLVLSYGVSLTAAVGARRMKMKNLAAALADIQLSALRTRSPSQVPVQSDGEPYGIIFSKGTWSVESDAGASSGTHDFLTRPSGATGITSVYPLPKDVYDDFTFEADVKIAPSSPSGWQAGLLFRSADTQNGYRVYLTSGSLVLERVVDGAATTLYSDVRSVPTDTWQTLTVTVNGSSISVDLNGLNVTNTTDTTYSIGMAGLIAWEGTEVRYDDIAMDGTTWDMESETVGAVPAGWERFGLSELPSGAMTLTSSELYGDSGFKRYTAKVTWDEGGRTRTLSQSTDVSD